MSSMSASQNRGRTSLLSNETSFSPKNGGEPEVHFDGDRPAYRGVSGTIDVPYTERLLFRTEQRTETLPVVTSIVWVSEADVPVTGEGERYFAGFVYRFTGHANTPDDDTIISALIPDGTLDPTLDKEDAIATARAEVQRRARSLLLIDDQLWSTGNRRNLT